MSHPPDSVRAFGGVSGYWNEAVHVCAEVQQKLGLPGPGCTQKKGEDVSKGGKA